MTTGYGVDVGGSGIKGAPVDLAAGNLIGKRKRIATPQPATPDAVYDVVAQVLASHDWEGPFGVAIPAVVTAGVAMSAANIDPSWIGTDVTSGLAKHCGTDVTVLNDADAAGLAEVRFGAGRGIGGVVIVLTFGTGVGSAVFVDGTLVPNTEFGHLEFRGKDAELSTAARLVEVNDMKIGKWAKRVNEYLDMLCRVFSPSRIIFGGGISKRFEDFSKWLDLDCEVVPAELRNQAGIVGAAIAASETRKENS